MLGSVREGDDAVQEAWLRASPADTSDVEDTRESGSTGRRVQSRTRTAAGFSRGRRL
jgi:hypothetical protein